MQSTGQISEVTRRNVIDYFESAGINWFGRLGEVEFLARLYNLADLPSTDSRFRTAEQDIWQHRVNNPYDWPDNWVFFDSRFDLLHDSDEVFLRFLCETVHPAVRPNVTEARSLVNALNGILKEDSWQLVEYNRISNRPVFAPMPNVRADIFEEPTGWPKVDRQLRAAQHQLRTAQTEEHFQLVGLLCRETLITLAQVCFDPTRHALLDGTKPSDTDAKRMLENFFGTELRGAPNDEARSHVKTTLNLAVALQHRRTADFTMAALCCEATTSVVNLVTILSGRRG